MGANAPPPQAEKVCLERAIDEKKDVKDESFLLIFQSYVIDQYQTHTACCFYHILLQSSK